MLASLPISLFAVFSVMAAAPNLQVSGSAQAGLQLIATGSDFPRNDRIQLTWDGSPSGMPLIRSDRTGSFQSPVTVPQTATVGDHLLAAGSVQPGKGKGSPKQAAAAGVLASVVVHVLAPTSSATPTPSPTVILLPSPTPTPTPTPTATAIASPTPTPRPSATSTPTPTPTPTAKPTPSPTPSPSQSTASGVSHVFVVVMENHGYSQVWNTSATPYTTALANGYARAANYYAITHPSLPNYLDIYGGSNYSITNDCSPSSSCHISARHLADNLEAAGKTWKFYQESMPGPCTLTTSGTYAPKHNPVIYFDDVRLNPTRCASHVVNYTALASDLTSAASTPNFAFITPNLCNDTHDCSVATGDTWLSRNMPAILSSPACTTQRCLLILTWDEDDSSQSNHVLTVFAGSAARTGSVSSTRYDHFSLLRTIESVLGVPTQTTHDAAATAMSDMLK
jgi:outer membrane biosynthesis protein TonB